MSDPRHIIWVWQRIVSPHMAGLVSALAQQGCDVTYVAEQVMSEDRARQGWTPPDLGSAHLEIASTVAAVQALVDSAPPNSIHICQGLRGNGLVSKAQVALAQRQLRQWVVMEMVDDTGWCGVLKRLEYWRLFAQWRKRLEGVLATGLRTPNWVVARGMPAERVFPFAYFLPGEETPPDLRTDRSGRFRFLFVGQFIKSKQLDLMITALATLKRTDVELAVIGSGELEKEWRTMANDVLPGRVDWIGRLPISAVRREMTKADCLVLPSRYDGWGAVVSEALMCGTPAICSDRCGSAGAVQASRHGGVFRSGEVESLISALKYIRAKGPLSRRERAALAKWAQCLGADSGARYLQATLDHTGGSERKPVPPWVNAE